MSITKILLNKPDKTRLKTKVIKGDFLLLSNYKTIIPETGGGGNMILNALNLSLKHNLPFRLNINDFWLVFIQNLHQHIAQTGKNPTQLGDVTLPVHAHKPYSWGNIIFNLFEKATFNFKSEMMLMNFESKTHLYSHAHRGALLGLIEPDYKSKVWVSNKNVSLSEIVISGSTQEWMDMGDRVMRLRDMYPNAKWIQSYFEMILQIISTKTNTTSKNNKWWEKWCYSDKEGRLSGFITSLFPINNQGLNKSYFNNLSRVCMVASPNLITIKSGLIGCTQDPVTLEIRCVVGIRVDRTQQ